MFSEKDLQQFQEKGISLQQVEQQIDNFKRGFPFINLSGAASTRYGMKVLQDDEADELLNNYSDFIVDLDVMKFVPASGAASRMFKKLFEFRQSYNKTVEDIENYKSDTGPNSIFDFFNRIEKFAFYNVFASIIFVLTIGLTAFYSSEAIISVFAYIKINPWIAPVILFSIIGAVWFLMENMTKKKKKK